MRTINPKPLLFAIGVSCFYSNAWALLKTDKSVINQDTGSATISVSFTTPVIGDLYLATQFNGQLYFFADLGTNFTQEPLAYAKKTLFSGNRVVLHIASEGVPPAIYPLYQVVTFSGKSPLDFNNWIGGLGGLSELKLSINLPNNFSPFVPFTPANTPTPVPTPAASPSPTPAPAPTPEPTPTTPVVLSVADGCTIPKTNLLWLAKETQPEVCTPAPTPAAPALDGKPLYQQYCESCHGSNPKQNTNNLLKGRDVKEIQEAISENKGNMGILHKLSDAILDAIATFLRTF